MAKGGYREGSGRKKVPDKVKLHTKTFCIEKELLDWLNTEYPKGLGQALVRKLLRKRFDKENKTG